MKKFLFILLLAGAGAWWYFVYQPQHANGDAAAAGAGAAGSKEGAAKTAGGSGGGGKGGKGSRETGPVPVVTGLVGKKDVPIFLDGLGNVQAFNTVTVRSRVDGQIDKVAFTEGQDVKTGDLLVQIDPRPYQAMFDQAAAKKSQDEAQLTNAKLDLTRYAELIKEKATPQKTFDTQKALVDQLEATVKADDANVESASVNLNYTKITSPLDGRVGIRLVDQGNIVHASDTTGLLVITQLKPIAVIFTLPEQNLGVIQQQMVKGQLKVIALGRDDQALSSEGSLSVVDNQIDVTTGTIKLKATFPNDNLALWPGQFVNVRLQVSVKQGATVVPAAVVQRGPEGTYAFVVKPDATVEVRPIKVGTFESGDALIDDGLKPGEKVVVDGQYRLQVGSSISEKTNPKGPGAGGSGGKNKGGAKDKDKDSPETKLGDDDKGEQEQKGEHKKHQGDGAKTNPVS